MEGAASRNVMELPQNPLRNDWTIRDVEEVIAKGDEGLFYVPICVSLDPPGRIWAERVCLRLAQHEDPSVRGNAIEGFGHLARTFGSLNRAAVEPMIVAGLCDHDEWVRGKADDAADDIEFFLGWVLPGREDRKHRPTCRRAGL
jgi:hypothetical protein